MGITDASSHIFESTLPGNVVEGVGMFAIEKDKTDYWFSVSDEMNYETAYIQGM